MISIIAAVGKNLELGKNNDLIWRLPNDLKFFKEKTNGKTIIMGYNTFLSLGRVLPNRKHIVISFDEVTLPKDVILVHSIEESLKYVHEETFIIGGASIYKQFIDLADKIYLTEINASSQADVYFPNFDKTKYKKQIIASNSDNGITYDHVLYEKNEN